MQMQTFPLACEAGYDSLEPKSHYCPWDLSSKTFSLCPLNSKATFSLLLTPSSPLFKYQRLSKALIKSHHLAIQSHPRSLQPWWATYSESPQGHLSANCRRSRTRSIRGKHLSPDITLMLLELCCCCYCRKMW